MSVVFERLSEGNTVTLKLRGRMSHGGGIPEFQEAVREILSRSFSGCFLVLDLSGMSRMDSSAIGAIVAQSIEVEKKNGELCLCDLTDRSKEYFRMTRLENTFRIFANRNEAVQSLKSQIPHRKWTLVA